MSIKVIAAIVICSQLFLACAGTKNSQKNTEITSFHSKIIFLNYSIERSSHNQYKIALISKKIVEGHLKNNQNQIIENTNSNDFICLQLDKKLRVLSQKLIKNPLQRHIEFVDDSLNYQTKHFNLNKTKFSIRLQLKEDTKYITITNFAKNKPLITSQIN